MKTLLKLKNIFLLALTLITYTSATVNASYAPDFSCDFGDTQGQFERLGDGLDYFGTSRNLTIEIEKDMYSDSPSRESYSVSEGSYSVEESNGRKIYRVDNALIDHTNDSQSEQVTIRQIRVSLVLTYNAADNSAVLDLLIGDRLIANQLRSISDSCFTN